MAIPFRCIPFDAGDGFKYIMDMPLPQAIQKVHIFDPNVNDPLGQGWILICTHLHEPEQGGNGKEPWREAMILDIYVREEYRRRGYGQQLLKVVQNSYDRVTTQFTNPTLNSPGNQLCMKCGFKAMRSLHKNRPGELIWKKEKKHGESKGQEKGQAQEGREESLGIQEEGSPPAEAKAEGSPDCPKNRCHPYQSEGTDQGTEG